MKTVLKNPITSDIKDSVSKCTSCLNFAVPFISSFAKTILNKEQTDLISDKRIITRFDDSYIHSFDLPVLKSLLDIGFKIKYDNNIHLKLYIADNEAYISSSNLTKGGFEDNVELTVKIDNENADICKNIFNNLWDNCGDNTISYALIESNLCKYELVRKRDNYSRKITKNIKVDQQVELDLENRQVIDIIFNQNKDFDKTLSLEFEANKLREEKKNKLRREYSIGIFYLKEEGPLRKQTLFYDFVYGYESQLAGTGLRESQFQAVFQHADFEKVVNYIFPEMIGMSPWNFRDTTILKEFCNGVFDFDIPSYKESLPIRLASYFYPNVFLPIFKLEHLKDICDAFGFETDAETRGDRLFIYNTFILEKMKALPYGNVVKARIAYLVRFTLELLSRMKNKESYENILNNYKKVWIKNFIEEGKEILIKLKKGN